MSDHLRIILVIATAIGVAWFGAACLRAVWRSRKLQAQYREASPNERQRFETRIGTDRELAAYVVPLSKWEYVPGLCGIGMLIIAKAGGYL